MSYPTAPSSDLSEFPLNTGSKIPSLGLGTWQSKPGEVEKAVESALRSGYRHLDCAWIYGNEVEVGKGIKNSGIDRKEIFVTTKIWCTFHSRVKDGLEESLKNLGLDYVDLLLVHWPIPLEVREDGSKIPLREDGSRAIDTKWSLEDTWKQMEEAYESGKTKAIGVSNWSIPYLERLLKSAKVVPAANQVELHPYLPQHDLVRFCQSKGIVAQAYSPLGSTGSPLLKDSAVQQIAQSHNADPGQVVLSWSVQRGVTPLPKSVTPSRIESNRKLVKLSQEEMKQLNELHLQEGKHIRYVKPNWGVDLEFPNWN